MNVSKLKNNKIARIAKKVIFIKPYTKYYEKLPVRKDVVLYESFYGKGMSCGPYAIFKELIGNSKYKNLQHIWVVDNKSNKGWEDNFSKYKNNEDVKFVQINSKEYYRYLATAGYLINNSTFPSCFIRKEEQEYINTWHGIPLKLMGYDMPNGNIEVANTERNFLQATYLLSPNKHHTEMYTEAYKLKGIYSGKIIEAGQVRTDSIINSNREDGIEELKKAEITISKEKILLYAPTWKGKSFSNPEIDCEEYIHMYEELSKAYEGQVLIKPHQAVYKEIVKKVPEAKKYMVSPNVDTNTVLSAVDVLISDYSSIFFDFLVTNKPILFYIPDLEKYKEDRGMYMKMEELPGPYTSDIKTLCQMVKNLTDAYKSKEKEYVALKEKMCSMDDGKVAKRVINAVFEKDYSQVKVVDTNTNKKKLFISLGRALQNGITHSFMNLVNNIDYDKYDVTAYLYEAVANDQVDRMNEINKNVRVLVRTNENHTFARREMVKLVLAMMFNMNNFGKKIAPEKYYKRQAKRIAGNTHFDAVVEFCGYSPILAMILPELNTNTTAIWQHNDLLADQHRKINHKKPLKRKMAMIFNLYDRWDRLVSCSHSVMEVNKKNLSRPGIENKFYFAKNTLNYDRVYKCLDEDVVYEGFPMPCNEDTNFVTMGRMSTEKNHVALVRGFFKYNKKYPKSRLYILGDGPLREVIENEIEKLGLKEKVILMGNQSNPFVLMSKCQCFILPSIYEGQPMVLLEARIVGLPIVVSSFSSVKDSLMENGQYVIKQDEESIEEGLEAFEKGKVPTCGFDPKKYNVEAMAEFYHGIGQD